MPESFKAKIMMDKVQFDLHTNGYGHFYINENSEQIAKMTVGIRGGELTVYHTEVLPKAQGKGLAKELVREMVAYARKNYLRVTPLCPYVFAEFSRHPKTYSDVWKMEETQDLI